MRPPSDLPPPPPSNYTRVVPPRTTKAGVVAFTRSVATQLAPYNINVNAVAPGPTDTGFAGIEQLRASPGFDTPMGRINEPLDIANAVLFLCTDEARNITGELLTVAGGKNPSI